MQIRPPQFPYPGAKSRLAAWVMSYLPPSRGLRFIEPCVGRANIYFQVRCSTVARRFTDFWLNDLQSIPFLQCLQDATEEQIREACSDLPPMQRHHFEELQANHGTFKAIILEPFVTYRGCGYSSFSYFNRHGFDGPTAEEYIEKLVRASAILKTRTKLTAGCATHVVLAAGPGDFMYIDVPYPGTNAGTYDTNDMEFHEDMVKFLQRTKAKWLLSCYNTEPYASLGKPFATKDIREMMSHQTANQNFRTECLWKNY